MNKISKLLFGGLLLVQQIAAQTNDPKWMRYSAISPDGKTIVFTFKGDLYKVSSQGGAATPLTMHEAHDF
ncbi:hypothetical protein ABTE16_21150, partial [Acinetobacter baumannii]